MPPPAVDIVIPALDEEASLPLVLADLAALREPPAGGAEPAAPWLRRIVVADNGSTDGTARVAGEAGAVVVEAPRPGYGSACLAGLAWLRTNDPPDVVAFLDADYSDHPDELPRVVAPILDGTADLVIGSRVLGERERGALLPQARAGNLVACWLIRLLYGHRYTDLGPFRAVCWPALERLGMSDPDFGWTAEMQVKALRHGLRITEVPVSYRKRVGVSKITGTLRGTILAGWKILSTVLRHSVGAHHSPPPHHFLPGPKHGTRPPGKEGRCVGLPPRDARPRAQRIGLEEHTGSARGLTRRRPTATRTRKGAAVPWEGAPRIGPAVDLAQEGNPDD